MYGEYCSNHEKALRLLMELNKIPNIRTFLLVSQHSSVLILPFLCIASSPLWSSYLSFFCIFMGFLPLPTMNLISFHVIMYTKSPCFHYLISHESYVFFPLVVIRLVCPHYPLTLFSFLVSLLSSPSALHFSSHFFLFNVIHTSSSPFFSSIISPPFPC